MRRTGGFKRKTKFTKRTSFRKRSFRKKRGFVKRYKKSAFLGHKVPTFGKYFRASGNRRRILWNIVGDYTNSNASVKDNSLIFMPLNGLYQNANTLLAGTNIQPIDTFSGPNIWLTGIKLSFIFNCNVPQDYYIRLMCFWTEKDTTIFQDLNTNAPMNGWTYTNDLANTADPAFPNKHNYDAFRFLDVPYTSASGYVNYMNYAARPNPTYPGKLLYDHKHKITCTAVTAAGGGNPNYVWEQYFPFNKLFNWSTVPFFSDDETASDISDLTIAPNFGKHGAPIFVMYFLDTEDVGEDSTQTALNWEGYSCVYFKDVFA